MTYEFEIIGEIKGKARPRLNLYTGSIYTSKNTKEYEDLVRQYFLIKYPRYVPFENRVSAKILACFKVPKSASKKNRENMLNGTITPIKKPDIDNIVKVILDSLNTIAFKDDTQVTKLEIEKIYGEEEKVLVKLEEY